MSRVERDVVPQAKSSFSTSRVRRPRKAASRATPVPIIPPPMMMRSKTLRPRALKSLFKGVSFLEVGLEPGCEVGHDLRVLRLIENFMKQAFIEPECLV